MKIEETFTVLIVLGAIVVSVLFPGVQASQTTGKTNGIVHDEVVKDVHRPSGEVCRQAKFC